MDAGAYAATPYAYAPEGQGGDAGAKSSIGGADVQDYGFRLYSPGIARFLSVDPLSPSYPMFSPYQFAGNRPIMAIDLDGLEPYDAVMEDGTSVKTSIRMADAPTIRAYTGYAQVYRHSLNRGMSVNSARKSAEILASSDKTGPIYRAVYANVWGNNKVFEIAGGISVRPEPTNTFEATYSEIGGTISGGMMGAGASRLQFSILDERHLYFNNEVTVSSVAAGKVSGIGGSYGTGVISFYNMSPYSNPAEVMASASARVFSIEPLQNGPAGIGFELELGYGDDGSLLYRKRGVTVGLSTTVNKLAVGSKDGYESIFKYDRLSSGLGIGGKGAGTIGASADRVPSSEDSARVRRVYEE